MLPNYNILAQKYIYIYSCIFQIIERLSINKEIMKLRRNGDSYYGIHKDK